MDAGARPRKFLFRTTVCMAALASLALLVLTAANLVLLYGDVPSKILTRANSPGGALEAVLTLRETGATVPTPAAVYVTRSGMSNAFQPVFLADHVEKLRLRWEDDRHLVISARRARIFRQTQTETVDLSEDSIPISIRYDIGEVAASSDDMAWDAVLAQSKSEDFGNVNFGATGAAAGFPQWLLDRWAGWEQKRAGTSRPEWGSPFGGAPYGDDPHGQVLINQGIDYAREHPPR